MGADESKLKPFAPVCKDFNYLCLICKQSNKIEIIHGSEVEHRLVEQVIKDNWKTGIDGTKWKCEGNVLCFKLLGLPFESGTFAMPENIREVLCEIFRRLNNLGYRHVVSTHLTKCRTMVSFIFTRERSYPGDINELGYLSINSNNKLQFGNLSDGIIDELPDLFLHYSPGVTIGNVAIGKVEDNRNVYEVELNGCPWNGKSSNHAEARYVLIKILVAIAKQYDFVCTMNIKNTTDAFVFCPKATLEDVRMSDFFIFTLRKTKKFQIYNASEQLIEVIHGLLTETLEKKGVRLSRKFESMSRKVEYKLTYPSDVRDKIPIIKFFVCKLLESLKAHGWSILTGFDMSRVLSSKTELLFQRSQPIPNCKAFCLSPLTGSRLALVNAPPNIVTACRKVINAHWHQPHIQHIQYQNIANCDVFVLDGSPWGDCNHSAYSAHSMLCHMLHTFMQNGYRIVLSADVIHESIEYDEGRSWAHDPNSWWFLDGPPSTFVYGELPLPHSLAAFTGSSYAGQTTSLRQPLLPSAAPLAAYTGSSYAGQSTSVGQPPLPSAAPLAAFTGSSYAQPLLPSAAPLVEEPPSYEVAMGYEKPSVDS